LSRASLGRQFANLCVQLAQLLFIPRLQISSSLLPFKEAR
jgi:hypothetical protein